MIKVRLQLAGGGNPVSLTRQIIAQDGFLSLYRGLSAGIARQLTYGTSRLGIFRTLSNKLKPADGSPLPFTSRLFCSLVAGGAGAAFGTPADAALVRMQADTVAPPDKRRGYKNVVDALLRMAREEGAKGFFSGAAPTVYRGLSINVGMLTSYDPYKRFLTPKLGDNRGTHFAAGALSGWTAATVSLPFDFVKTRMQRADPGQYKNFVDAFGKLLKSEGPLGFYAGYPTYVIRITPHIMITWVMLEWVGSILPK